VTRAQTRFRLALIVMGMDGVLLAALIVMAMTGKHVSGDNILFMASGVVLGWGGMVLHSYFGTTEGASRGTSLREPDAIHAGDEVTIEKGEQ